MELVFIQHGNVFDVHYFATWLSIVILVGAIYGALRLLIDVLRVVPFGRRLSARAILRWLLRPPTKFG